MNKVIVKINSKQKNDKQNTIKMKALANAYTKNGILYVIFLFTVNFSNNFVH